MCADQRAFPPYTTFRSGAFRSVPAHHSDESRAEPSRAVPCRAVPCRAVPCRAVPCRAVTCHAVTFRVGAEPTRLYTTDGHPRLGTESKQTHRRPLIEMWVGRDAPRSAPPPRWPAVEDTTRRGRPTGSSVRSLMIPGVCHRSLSETFCLPTAAPGLPRTFFYAPWHSDSFLSVPYRYS